MLEEETQKLAVAMQQSNIDYTNVQAQNAIQDNLKQLMVALDKSEQEWTKIGLDAGKNEQVMPAKSDIDALYAKAQKLVSNVMMSNVPAADADPQGLPAQQPNPEQQEGVGV